MPESGDHHWVLREEAGVPTHYTRLSIYKLTKSLQVIRASSAVQCFSVLHSTSCRSHRRGDWRDLNRIVRNCLHAQFIEYKIFLSLTFIYRSELFICWTKQNLFISSKRKVSFDPPFWPNYRISKVLRNNNILWHLLSWMKYFGWHVISLFKVIKCK